MIAATSLTSKWVCCWCSCTLPTKPTQLKGETALLFHNSAPGGSRCECGIRTKHALHFLTKTFSRQRNHGYCCAEEPPLHLRLSLFFFLASMQPCNLDVISLSTSASWRPWRSGGRAGNGSNGTSPRGRRSMGCHSMTGRTLSCCHSDPCPSSHGCRALCPYLANNRVKAAEMNLHHFSSSRRALTISVSGLPGMVLSRTKPKNPPMNMWVVKSTTMTWSSSFTPGKRDV